MPLPIWIGLALLLLVTAAGAVHVFFRARSFMRTAKRASAEMDGAVRHLERSIDELNAKVETTESRAARLEESVARLRRSLARLAVLRTALQDSLDSFAWLTAVYPRK